MMQSLAELIWNQISQEVLLQATAQRLIDEAVEEASTDNLSPDPSVVQALLSFRLRQWYVNEYASWTNDIFETGNFDFERFGLLAIELVDWQALATKVATLKTRHP